MRKIIFFDTETTGLPKYYNAPISQLYNWPRLVQLAFIEYYEDGSLAAKHNYIIRPEGFTIPQSATLIHRISHEKARSEGHSLKEVLNIFQQASNEAAILIAHNFDFDKSIIGAEFLRNSMDLQSFLNKRSFCTMKDQNIINFCQIRGTNGLKWPKLEDLYWKIFQEKMPEAHDAFFDTQATARCFWELLIRGIIKA
ncbi:Exonuclease RNase T and DNA polymerase III [Emticicia oligotrophica DSM 17448]|uniref:Exonuclease RNase T and DNA polymerase III n=1 Tax=Emticicia oligotrophica (strain DSM 17448 / CIP 109782 / MTCC 6937 / GPTSA100-15) TaxID=929562 RepID=A0ABN4AKT8_EMTOG|nr:3'-5' exonuclease [Emticicia oligotrophica]AFK02479.1 Exonuclease RNase T and DNA polymerase III [Emticicia oligotrophica DSM 17448]